MLHLVQAFPPPPSPSSSMISGGGAPRSTEGFTVPCLKFYECASLLEKWMPAGKGKKEKTKNRAADFSLLSELADTFSVLNKRRVFTAAV